MNTNVPVPDPDAPHPFRTQLDAIASLLPEQVALADSAGVRITRVALARLCSAQPPATGPVAVLGTSTPALAAAVAHLYAGAPVSLVDPALVAERLHDVLTRSGATRIVVDPASAPAVEAAAAPGAVEVVDAAWLAAPREPSGAAPTAGTEVDAPASIVWTSGSTGRPKGVALTHGAVVNGAAVSRREFDLTSDDRIALVLPPAYAAGQEMLFMALLNGCTLEIRESRTRSLRDVGAWLRDRRITTLHATPSLLRHLTGAVGHERHDDIRLFTTCGEAAHGRDIDAARTWMPNARYANFVGSSETGHLSFRHVLPGEELEPGVIGAGRTTVSKVIRAHDERGELLAPGEAGRLRMTSRHLALGYWGDPDATDAVFERQPDGRRTFLSGDRGRVDADGTLTLQGRGDDVVKVRGYLVAPIEVESALRGLDVVDDAVVVPDHDQTTRLVGYVVPDPTCAAPSSAQLRTALRERLPEWMVPQTLVLLPELPRTERGKVDRAALPAAPARSTDTVPADQWEALVSRHWRAVLGLTEVGRAEDFFALGGDSLAVEELLVRLADEQIILTGADLGAAPTLSGFAAVVRRRARASSTEIGDRGHRSHRGIVVPLREGGERLPVHCFAGAGGPAYLFSELAQQLAPGHPVTAFQQRGLERRGIPDWSVTAAARRYLRILDERGHHGPAVLVGHSLGGLFALEVAHLLRARGHQVPLLVMLDTVLPGHLARAAGDEVPRIRIPGAVGQTRGELWRTRLRLLGAGWYPFASATRDDVFFQHGLRITERHRPQPWDGPAEVFLTAENIDGRDWWQQVLTGARGMHELPCTHLAVIKQPWIGQVADRINAVLHGLDAPTSAPVGGAS